MSEPVTLDSLQEANRALYRLVADLRGEVAAIARHLGVNAAPAGQASIGRHEFRVAADSELEGEWGDKVIRKDPPRYRIESFVGRKWSEASADYLDALAGFLDWTATKDRGAAPSLPPEEAAKKLKYADYADADAAKVRAWAKRKRAEPEGL